MVKRVAEKKLDLSSRYKHTEYPGRDRLYNWIVRKHEEKGKPWTSSDGFIWGGFLYYVWDWVPVLAYLYFTYWIVNFTYARAGEFRAITVLVIMVLIRINALIRQAVLTNRLLKKLLEIEG